MYRITVEQERDGVWEQIEEASIETPGYMLAALKAGVKNGARYQVQSLSRGDIIDLLLNNKTFLQCIAVSLPVLPLALKQLEETDGEEAQEIDAEALLKNVAGAKAAGKQEGQGLLGRLLRKRKRGSSQRLGI